MKQIGRLFPGSVSLGHPGASPPLPQELGFLGLLIFQEKPDFGFFFFLSQDFIILTFVILSFLLVYNIYAPKGVQVKSWMDYRKLNTEFDNQVKKQSTPGPSNPTLPPSPLHPQRWSLS